MNNLPTMDELIDEIYGGPAAPPADSDEHEANDSDDSEDK